MKKLKSSQKGVALLASLIVSVAVFSYASIAFMSFVSDEVAQTSYENNLQVLYDLESANTACMWETATSGYAWNTVTNNPPCRLANSAVGAGGSYRLGGYNFRAKVFNNAGQIEIYAHGFQNTEASPRYSRYLVRLYSPSPMYQYAMFSSRSITFPSAALYDCKGGKIHSNGDLIFNPTGGSGGLRFNNISEMSCVGSLRYDQRRTYPEPYIIDSLDGKADGMAPAPYYNNPYYTTTTGEALPANIVGPDRRYSSGFDPFLNITYWAPSWKWYGNWVGDNWGSSGKIPLIWRGDETYFYGRQYQGSGYDTGETTLAKFMRKDGTIGTAASPDLATVENFYLNSNNTLITSTSNPGEYFAGDVYFSPTKDKLGNANNGTWYEIPAALPQARNWTSKYTTAYTAAQNSQPVTFYATELCQAGDSGCNFDNYVTDPALQPSLNQTGWRYIRKDGSGNICKGNGCYDNKPADNVTAGDYNNYFSNFAPLDYDKDKSFFSNYTYGSDYGKSSTYAMVSQQQTQGFQEYMGKLSDKSTEGVLRPGVEKKTPYLGKIFDDANGSSQYKTRAQSSGLYIDPANVDTLIGELNTGVPASEAPVAKNVTFVNWMTNQPVTLVDINISQMNKYNKAPANGIVYSKVPIRMSSAEVLPGANGGGKTAVFTVLSEESVYLKGDYNTGGTNGSDWKISNIATKKKVYTLSNNFNDPSQAPDYSIYPEYPYVYMKGNNSAGYQMQEGTPSAGDGTWVDTTQLSSTYTYNGTSHYTYYGPMDATARNWAYAQMQSKRSSWNTSIENGARIPPNNVDKDTYAYNSLFITPYNSNQGDRSLENWYYYNTTTNSLKPASVKMQGAFLDFFDPTDPNYSTTYRSNACSEGGADNTGCWNYYRGNPYHPNNSNYIYSYGKSLKYGSFPSVSIIQAYDSRFPTAVPQTTDGVLGFTGSSVWRLISEAHARNRAGF